MRREEADESAEERNCHVDHAGTAAVSGPGPPAGAGHLHIVLDGRGTPVCVIQTTEVMVRPFREVDARFAHDYGEGERTLTWWQRHLWDYYAAECTTLGWQASQDIPLVCERFRLVFPARPGAAHASGQAGC